MANYNKERYLAEAIESMQKQIFAGWELIIVDDYSTDNSVKIIENYLGDKRIRLFSSKKNQGYIYSLKKGIEKSSGEIVVILDSDDALSSDALEKVHKAYNANHKTGMVYTQCYYCDKNLKPKHLGFSEKIIKSNLHENKINAMRTFKKEAYLKTAGYDKKCIYAEDIDLNLKLEEVTKLYFFDEPLYYYRILPKSQTHSFKNTRINRSSTALAKLNAYKRRLGTDIPNLNKTEISEMLFFGIINSLLAGRLKLVLKFKYNLFLIHPFFFLDIKFYQEIYKKIKKIIELKKEKSLMKI